MADAGDLVLACWTQAPDGRPRRHAVHPDGCRDLIGLARPDGRCHWFVTDLADGSYTVPSDGWDHFLGFRLRPGMHIDTARLLAAVQRLTPGDEGEVRAWLAEHTHWSAFAAEALAALAQAPSVAAAARRVGLSERAFERRVWAHTQRPPVYWLQLARVRRSACLLAGALPLAEVAVEAGYADQSHLIRACRRWFGTTPGALRADADSLAAATAQGYASDVPMGVHSSTTKPLRSAT